MESLLGLWLEVARLRVAPCLPAQPEGLTIHYRSRETVYHIHIGQVSKHTVEVSGPVI